DGTQALIGVVVPEAQAERRTALAMVDTATGERRMLLDQPGTDYSPGPISPDGTRAAVVVSPQPHPGAAIAPNLHVVDLASVQLTRIGADVDLWRAPAATRSWIASSRLLATAGKDGRGAVFVVDAAAGTAAEIPVEDAVYSEVIRSPEGQSAF